MTEHKEPVSLATLMTPSRTVEIDYPNYEGLKFKVTYLAREVLIKLRINCVVTKPDQIEKIISSFDGIINCTPVGHYDFPGCPLGNLMPNKKQWIFDVVYTPAKTNFINKGEQVGAKIISGIDLFIFQAIDAFLFFTEIYQ